MFPGIDPEYRRAQLFLGNSTLTNTNPVSYQVPYGARLLYVFGAGAGAGGGGGASGPSGTTRGGAGGTSTVSTVEAIIPTALIPTTLLLAVGMGGIGGDPGASGTGGGLTRIILPQRSNLDRSSLLTLLDFGAASPGLPGTTSGFGAGANFASMISYPPALAVQLSLGGGANGGAHTGGSSPNSGSALNLNSMSTGGGGVGTNDVSFAAGNAITYRHTVLGGTAASGFNGNNGYTSDPLDFQSPFVRNGATGGASNGTGTGGNGGNGSLSVSGGGGGGGVTGGRGGNGGDGFIVIVPVF